MCSFGFFGHKEGMRHSLDLEWFWDEDLFIIKYEGGDDALQDEGETGISYLTISR